MSITLVNGFYALASALSLWCGLLRCASLKKRRHPRLIKTIAGVVAAIVVFVPIAGLPLWIRVFSFYPNPSLPTLGIVVIALWQSLRSTALFKPADWHATWVFGALAGTLLYLHAAVFDTIDLYYWGWERDTAMGVIAFSAIVIIAWGNRLGVLLLGALLAYAFNALESGNAWDYIIDPVYWVISLGVVGQRLIARLIRARPPARPRPL